MTNRLADLESNITRAHKKKVGMRKSAKRAARTRKPQGSLTRVSTSPPPASIALPPTSAAPAVAKGLSGLVSRWPARTPSRAGAFGTIDYTIPGVFGPLAQPSGNSCWATVFTMLVSWRRQQSLSIETALATVGQKWVDLYKADTGLPGDEKSAFLTTAGLIAEPPQSYSLDGWEQLLRNYGPVWVTTDEALGRAWAIHARVITAIRGDGTPEKTFFTIVDPAGGRQYQESIATFIPKYEEEVIRTGYMRIQVVHWTADARAEVRAQSLGRRLVRPFAQTTPEYPQASRFVPAAPENYRASTQPRAIERIVVHITDGSANINGTISWFQNPEAKVSAHYVVGQDGEVVQMVAHNDVAWHAGSANANSIGIEHVANTRGLIPTAAQYCASAALVTWLCDQFGIAVDRAHVVGHTEADPSTKHTGCPNAVWDWNHYMGLVTSRSCYPPAAQQPSIAKALSAPPASELANTVAQLRAGGTADEDIRQFLRQIGASYTFAMGVGPEGVTVTLPGGHVLSGMQSELLLAAIAAEMAVVNPALAPVVLPFLHLLPAVANRFDVTIGIGAAISGGAVAGASFGAGIMFAPGNRIGFCGSLGGVLGALVSISATLQVTVVRGGLEIFGGTAVAVTIGGGEGVVGSASALLSQGRFIGVTFAMGVGAGLSPIEAYAQYQYTPTSLGLAYARGVA